MLTRAPLWLGAAALAVAPVAEAQRPITRAEAIAAALARGPRIGVTAPDTLMARGGVLAARAYPNPSASASYSKDYPRRHVALDVPLDFPWLRSTRIGAAEAARSASAYRFAFERTSVQFDAEVAYTQAAASAARGRLSRRTAQDGDSLLALARLRRETGDAADLDVELAVVNAGQLANQALDDSMTAVADLLELQRVMGLASEQPTISLADTLVLPGGAFLMPADTVTLQVAAAEADLRSAEQALAFEHGNIVSGADLQVGFDAHNLPGEQPGLLPVIGLSVALPLFNWNGGAIVSARADRDRAAALLDVARKESAAAIAQAMRARSSAITKATRDRLLLASADRVAAMALVAYGEGASALPSVLEAERHAREVAAQLIDDTAAAIAADAAVRLLTTPPQ